MDLSEILSVEEGNVKFTVNVALDALSALWLAAAIFTALVLALLIYSRL